MSHCLDVKSRYQIMSVESSSKKFFASVRTEIEFLINFL